MYVRWKMLITLGVVFWCLSCTKEYFWTSETETSPVLEKPHVQFEDGPELVEPKEEATGLVGIVFWNFVAFVSTLSVCFTLKSLAKLWFANGRENLANSYEDGVVPLRRNHSSKIPIPITGKTSSTDIHIDGVEVILAANDDSNKSCPNFRAGESSDAEKDEAKPNRVWSIRNMEKHCAKLREEMINLQASSLKEHSTISKKMDALAKEKREFIRQMNALRKENRSLKQKMEEMLEERALLIQRLDCATKEIRVNTRSKKTTMTKLEEALANAEKLKSNLHQISRDKLMLEDKVVLLDAEYTRLKEELALHKNSQTQFRSEDEREHVIDGPEEFADAKSQMCDGRGNSPPSLTCLPQDVGDFDISQTEEDMKRMQQKLLNLEKSLESFRFRQTTPNKDANDVGQNQPDEDQAKPHVLHQDDSMSTIDEEPSTNSICTEPGCPLEHRECTSTECFLKNVDHKLHLQEFTDFSSGDESLSSGKPFFRKAEKPQENLSPKRHPVKYVKSSISDDRLSVISERATTTGEDSGEDYEPQRRISESPEFQKFLKKVIDPPPIDSPRFNLKLENALTNYYDV